MRCWAIDLELAGHMFDIPAMPAADWWPVLTTGDLALILDFIEDTGDLDDLILDGRLPPGALADALTDAIEVTAGRTLHAAMVLATVATSHWASINGTITGTGFRWDGQPLGAALDAIHAEITSRLEKADLAKFMTLLDNEALTGRKRGRGSSKAAEQFEMVAGPKPTSGVKSTGGPSDNARPRTRTQPRPPHPAAQSPAPTPQPGPPAGNAQQATTGSPGVSVPPTSDTAPHPHPPGH